MRAPVTLPSGNRKRCGDRFKLGSEGIRRLSHRGVFHRVQDHHLRGFGHDRLSVRGFQPVCGFSYGAGLYERVVKAFWFCVKVSTVILVLLSVAGFILAPGLISLFRSGDPLLIAIGSRALRYQCLSFPLTGLIIMANMMLQNIGKTLPASVLAMGRQGVFFCPSSPAVGFPQG